MLNMEKRWSKQPTQQCRGPRAEDAPPQRKPSTEIEINLTYCSIFLQSDTPYIHCLFIQGGHFSLRTSGFVSVHDNVGKHIMLHTTMILLSTVDALENSILIL